ncbi:hypothetical protein Tco_0319815 [Tanacetum coccineum]
MYTSYITIFLDSKNESTGSSISYIILSESNAKETASPAALAPPSPDYIPSSQDYVLASNTKTKPFEAPTLPNYASGLDTKTEPFEEDPQEAEHDLEESSEEDPSKEDPTEKDEPLLA